MDFVLEHGQEVVLHCNGRLTVATVQHDVEVLVMVSLRDGGEGWQDPVEICSWKQSYNEWDWRMGLRR